MLNFTSNTVTTASANTSAADWLAKKIRRSAMVGMFTEVVSVNADLAAAMLAKNTGNRPLSLHRVAYFSDIINSNRWLLSSQGISFAPDGTLNNGQHRLHGIMDANAAVDISVTFGEPREAFVIIDNGKSRTPGDNLTIAGEEHGRQIAAALRALASVTTGQGRGRAMMSTQIAMEWLTDHPLIRASVNPGARLSTNLRTGKGGVSKAGAIVAHYLIQTMSDHSQKLDVFWGRVCTGLNIVEARDPVNILRKAIVNAQTRKSSGSEAAHVAAMIINAWNAHILGKKPSSVSWPDAEAFPKVL